MRKRFPSAIAAVTLGWLAGTGAAAEPAPEWAPVAGSQAVFPEPGHEKCNTDGGFTAGAAVLYVKPYFQSNPGLSASRVSVSPDGTAATIGTAGSDFDYSYTASPRLWVGWGGEGGLGARISWWRFDQGAKPQAVQFDTPVTAPLVGQGAASQAFFVGNAGAGAVTPPLAVSVGPLVGSDGETPAALVATSNLKVDVWDLEVTQDCNLSDWGFLLSGGVRYAHIDQNYNAFSSQPNLPAGQLSNLLLTGHNFDGLGPTLAVELQRPLGHSGLALIANVRGSALFGSGQQLAALKTVLVPADGGPTLATTSVGAQTHDNLVGIIETELGVQYSTGMAGSRLFVRPALVGQYWSGAGNASSQTGDFGFFGFQLDIGVTY